MVKVYTLWYTLVVKVYTLWYTQVVYSRDASYLPGWCIAGMPPTYPGGIYQGGYSGVYPGILGVYRGVYTRVHLPICLPHMHTMVHPAHTTLCTPWVYPTPYLSPLVVHASADVARRGSPGLKTEKEPGWEPLSVLKVPKV